MQIANTITRPDLRTPRSSVVALVVLLLTALGACGASNSTKTAQDIESYVSLGDSYTSGVGQVPEADRACYRSAVNYPSLVAKDLGFDNFVDASCGGATSDNLRTVQKTPKGTNNPQLDSIPPDADLVTLGLGMNNGGFSRLVLYSCLKANGGVSPGCGPFLQQPQAQLDRAVAVMGNTIRTDIRDIRRKAAKARIVLVGYPRILPDDATCPAVLAVPDAAAVKIRYTMKKVNEVLMEAARSASADYIDTWSASRGHEVCSAQPWVNGNGYKIGRAVPLHPYEAYHTAVAEKLAALLDEK